MTDHPDWQPSDLAEVLDFRPDQGIIRLHEQRVVILSAAAMGLLAKELIDTLGLETARRLLLRFGYADGYHDAVSLRDRSSWSTPLDGLREGTAVHRLEGIVRAEIVHLEHDPAADRFDEEVRWHDSYVAEQHVVGVVGEGRRDGAEGAPRGGSRFGHRWLRMTLKTPTMVATETLIDNPQ